MLVRRALAGDDRAYGDLVRRHQWAALRVAAGICGSTEEARDIVQDAFVKGHRALRSWRGDAPVRSWLLRIVANDARNAVPRPAAAGGGGRSASARCARSRGGDPVGDAVAGDDEARALLALLGRLDERDRAVLACRFVAGLSERETAVALDVPVGTVKSRTARALERARALVDGGGVMTDVGLGAAPRSPRRGAAVPRRRRAGRRRAWPRSAGAPTASRWQRVGARRGGRRAAWSRSIVAAVPDSRHAVARWLGLERVAGATSSGSSRRTPAPSSGRR